LAGLHAKLITVQHVSNNFFFQELEPFPNFLSRTQAISKSADKYPTVISYVNAWTFVSTMNSRNTPQEGGLTLRRTPPGVAEVDASTLAGRGIKAFPANHQNRCTVCAMIHENLQVCNPDI
jgi:hypothetical protein